MNALSPLEKPLRILHVLGSLDLGGVETWLLHVLRHIDPAHFQMDFLVHTARPGAFDAEVRALGSSVFPCLGTSRPWVYARNFRRILKERGPYDIVHSHVHHYSGYVLRLAHAAGVPVRIAHSHSINTTTLRDSGSPRRQLYMALTERWVARHATAGLAASTPAAHALFGPNWQADPRWRVLYYGIDTEAFRSPPGVETARAELGLAPDDLVIGHVGRFAEQKNHRFLVRIASEVVRQEQKARFLLVGTGPLRHEIEQLVAQEGPASRVDFAGARYDVPRLLVGAMDLFLFPSIDEGLPLGLLEAQAAGLPCVVSTGVPKEAYVVAPLIRPVSLNDSASTWANIVLSTAAEGLVLTREEARQRVGRSPFSIETSARELADFYLRASATSQLRSPGRSVKRVADDAHH